MIPLNEVTVVGADAAVLSWPVRARLESIGIIPNKMQIRTSGAGHWQPIDINTSQDSSGDGNPSNDPDQGGTLWVFEYIGGKWYASGAERLRPSQLNGDKPVADPSQGGLSTLIGNGWLYDSKWGPMAGVNPKPGDIVGFMVTSGSTRLDSTSREKERTDVVACRWPGPGGALPFEMLWREGETASTPAPVVTPPATSQPPVESWQVAFMNLSKTIDGLVNQSASQRERIDALEAANQGYQDQIAELAKQSAERAAETGKVADRVTSLEQRPSPAPVNVGGILGGIFGRRQ